VHKASIGTLTFQIIGSLTCSKTTHSADLYFCFKKEARTALHYFTFSFLPVSVLCRRCFFCLKLILLIRDSNLSKYLPTNSVSIKKVLLKETSVHAFEFNWRLALFGGGRDL
jgi:hypothetical protein